MVGYTLEERWEIPKTYFQNNSVVAESVRKLRTKMGSAPSAQYVASFVKKMETMGMLIDKPTRDRPFTVRTPENIEAVERRYHRPIFLRRRRRQQRYGQWRLV